MCSSDLLTPEDRGRTLAELCFRQHYGVTVVGIRHGDEEIVSPGANQTLEPGDRIIVIGDVQAIARLREAAAE